MIMNNMKLIKTSGNLIQKRKGTLHKPSIGPLRSQEVLIKMENINLMASDTSISTSILNWGAIKRVRR